MLGLRHFTMICNNDEFRKMDQDVSLASLGQLYNVQNKKISYTKHWLSLLIYKDDNIK